ncbi:ABC transporter permease [Vineibacter terrae]|uniref:ABC transporter permease n=1 Tax=Vineibacter terrae TaxID=2586908 RepID=UPI002E344B50|nr:ABC transporter permease [Vineibacter terrae]HEX2885067.1 ABC transporter permease [Vineibacter terrae]
MSADTMDGAGGRVPRMAMERWRPMLLLFPERIILPVLTAAGLLLVWEIVVRHYEIPPALLPAPSQVGQRLWEVLPLLLEHSVPTTLESALGFVLASLLGVGLAILLTYSRLFAAAVYPTVVVFQLIPKIALAPLFVVWLGIEMQSRLAFAVFISFFPIVIATEAGLRNTPPDMLRLCKALTATGWQIFTSVRLPYAVPYIFSGMKIAVTFAIIGVIVGEFISAQKGLGYIIIFASSQADTALILAAIFVLCVVGLALFGAVAAAERLVVRRYGFA